MASPTLLWKHGLREILEILDALHDVSLSLKQALA